MIVVKINGQDYRIASDWNDVTIQNAIDLLAIELPAKLKKLYDAYYLSTYPDEDTRTKSIDEITASITDKEGNKIFPTYYKNVIAVLSDIPVKILNQTDVISIRTLYYEYLQKLVEGCHYLPVGFDQGPIASFEFEGVEYLLPMDKEVFGKRVPMINVSALEFTESADLMTAAMGVNKKDYTKLPVLIAVLCRPEGESYDEDKALERAEKFKGLSMLIYWKVFFSLITPLSILLQLDQISLMQEAIKDPEI